ncbi:DUF397 domain-containing protein [Streptomyces antibioticus]|uniref:DUF397 domain-containing protein n=1 Tax=Streptomyces antibioticus TaxID=1890 RepID=UPI000A6F2E6B|nr:DUF397 domain-containing protein [Streptomyces antibioticus]MCX5169555.1 DUF397 domain-containing protein [Streptomyces antibioticus]
MAETLHWQKSTFSGGAEGNACVELAVSPATLHLRESDTPGTVLTTTPSTLAGLLEGIRGGSVPTPPAACP